MKKKIILSAVIGIAVTIQAHSAETQPKEQLAEQFAKQFFAAIKKKFPADKLEKIELCFTPSIIFTSQYSTESRVCFEGMQDRQYTVEEKTAFIFDIGKSEYKKLQDSLFKSEEVTKPRIEIPKNQLKTVIKFTFENKKTFFISEYLISCLGIWLKTDEKELRLNLSRKQLNQIIRTYMTGMKEEHIDIILEKIKIISDCTTW